MTYYTMYKMLKCLLRDESNKSDIEEMVRQEIQLKYNCDVTDDKIDGYYYKATVWFWFDDPVYNGVIDVNVDLKAIAMMLVSNEGLECLECLDVN